LILERLVRTILTVASGAVLCAAAISAWMTGQPFVGGGPALTALLGCAVLLSVCLGSALAALLHRSGAGSAWTGAAWMLSGAFLLAAQTAQPHLLTALEPQGLLVAMAVAFLVFFLPPLSLLAALVLTVPNAAGRARRAGVGRLTVSGLAATATFGVSIQWGLATFGVARWLTLTGCVALACAALSSLPWVANRVRRLMTLSLILGLILAGWTAPHPGPHAHGLRALQHTGTAELRILDQHGDRHLLMDGEPILAIDPATGDAVAPDPSTLELMLQFFWPPGKALLLGLPDPAFVRALSQRGWSVDVAAPRRALDLAQQFLGLDDSLYTWVMPSQVRLGLLDPTHPALPQRYQIIVVQLRGSAPGLQAFATRRGVQVLHQLLHEEGIVLIRLEAPSWGHPWPRAVSAALLERFREVWCLPVTGGPRNAGSLVLAAADRYLDILQHNLPTPQDHPNHPEAQLRSGRARNAWRYRFVPDVTGAQVLELADNPAPYWLDAFRRAEHKRLHHRVGGQTLTW
jgi:hypothetical protein